MFIISMKLSYKTVYLNKTLGYINYNVNVTLSVK